MASIKEIEERQKRLLELGERIRKEEDLNRMLEMCQQAEQQARELEEVAVAFDQQMRKQAKEPPKGGVEVVLTPDQRARILKETGVSMMTVVIDDPNGNFMKLMPETLPPVIEAEALRQARARKGVDEAKQESKVAIERQLTELEGYHELNAEEVAKLRKDPKFLAALGLDKK
jgi:hypothetical protein